MQVCNTSDHFDFFFFPKSASFVPFKHFLLRTARDMIDFGLELVYFCICFALSHIISERVTEDVQLLWEYRATYHIGLLSSYRFPGSHMSSVRREHMQQRRLLQFHAFEENFKGVAT